ncbi:MAG: phytoene desaturase family protein [Leptospirillia bacterium]
MDRDQRGDVAIVGGGVGGVLTGAMLAHAGRSVILFEAMDYLGGCSGTFERDGYAFNAGATTLIGLESTLPLGKLASLLGVSVPTRPIDPALKIHLHGRSLRMSRNREALLAEFVSAFPEDAVEGLWRRVFRVADAAWSIIADLPPFPPRRPQELARALGLFALLLARGGADTLRRGNDVFSAHVKTVDLRQCLDQLLLITNQAPSREVWFLSAALGLSYTTQDTHTAMGGMGAVVEAFAKKIPSVIRKTPVRRIEPQGSGYLLHTPRGSYSAQTVILNRDIWGAASLFGTKELKEWADQLHQKYPDRWGAATLHFMVRDVFPPGMELHHQIHHPRNPDTGSHSFFLSLSHPEDSRLSPPGYRSVTISTHTDLALWKNLSGADYHEKKERVQEFILSCLFRSIPEFLLAEKGEILVGSPRTFARYTRRTEGTVGGIPLRMRDFPFHYPSFRMPLKKVYLVGDTVFPGQGWPGVAVGAMGLVRHLEPRLLP